jgi:hypothetical protein
MPTGSLGAQAAKLTTVKARRPVRDPQRFRSRNTTVLITNEGVVLVGGQVRNRSRQHRRRGEKADG